MKIMTALALAALIGTSNIVLAQDAATIGSGGSAAAGDTSASTVGTGGTSTDAAGDSTSSIGSAGSAATADGKAKSDTKIVDNPNMLKGQSKAMAHDGGTFSKSMTKTKVTDDGLSSDTKSMSHVPGEKPVKSRTSVNTDAGG